MNPRPIWFKRKWYGWGWYPATWQGWAILAAWTVFFVVGEIAFIGRLESEPSLMTVALFLTYTALLVGGLIVASYRYGETPRWQWGRPKDE